MILGHDGSVRHRIDEAAGLVSKNVLSSFQDREGALWLGTGAGVARVEENSPVSIVAHTGGFDVIPFHGSIYFAAEDNAASVQRIIVDPVTGQPSVVKYTGPNQSFSLVDFKDPSGKTPDQLLVSTTFGIMKIEGDKLELAVPALQGPSQQTYNVFQSRKSPNRVFRGLVSGVGSMQ